MKQREAVIVAYGRSACCRARKGSFADMHPVDYAAQVLKGVLARVPQLYPACIGYVITGCAMPINELHMNTSRLIVNRAGLPDCVPAQTINRFCSSGLQAISTAANAIIAGQYDCAVAGGVESMSRCFMPYPKEYENPWIRDHYEGGYMSMGETAERVAEHYDISREDMEKMALESHEKAAKARTDKKLEPSIIPVQKENGTWITEDEGILADAEGNLATSMEKMASMKPCFRENGRVTAATSSQTTDAAAYVVVMEREMAEKLGIHPIAKYRGFAVAGCDPTEMGMGPMYAIPKVDADKVNPYGGAMALGHPMGATGAILTGKALDYLADTNQKYALISMCIGGGMGAAGIFEYL